MYDHARLTQHSDLHSACRLLAGGVSQHFSKSLATRLHDDFNNVGQEVLVKLLMLSFSGVVLDMR